MENSPKTTADFIVPRLITNVLFSGGCSVNALLQVPESGYMVSIKAGPVLLKTENLYTPELYEFVKDNLVLHDSVIHQFYFGSWLDTETDKVYFDLSKQFNTFDAACAVALKLNQIAIWDVANNCEIRLKNYRDGQR